MTVAEVEFLGCEGLDLARIRQDLNGGNDVSQRAFPRSRVHDEAAADGSRTSNQGLDPAQAPLRCLLGRSRHHDGGAHSDMRSLEYHRAKFSLEVKDQPANALV